ncbi:VWA domain-containing protein [Rhodopirellula sp. MGV]|uniref:VWA domain-containing protein n=1 Tax=Rhodopirellula sp. MGV TaxID=2023130 RepID=UPI00117A927A|nr:VWA domain-containing protein [Rhodopirellula sp. MGV]
MAFEIGTLAYLPLLLLIPLFWFTGQKLAQVVGRKRAFIAITLRSLVIACVVLALSELQFGWLADRLAVVYVLDQSDSISAESRRAMLEYAKTSATRDRNEQRQDMVGMVAFAGDARIETPPYEAALPSRPTISGDQLNADATNLEKALDLAVAAMPPESRQRVVVLTDGHATAGDAQNAASRAAKHGIGIDIVPVARDNAGDVAITRLDVPQHLDAGQSFSGRLIVEYQNVDRSAKAAGNITVTQTTIEGRRLVLSEAVELSTGKTVLPFNHVIQDPSMVTFHAEFVPKNRSDDRHHKNNQVSSYVWVGGPSRTLLIKKASQPGEFDFLVETLRQQEIEVEVRQSDAAFDSLADLMSFDSVILANLPKAGGDSAETIGGLSDRQVDMLVRNTQRFGAGLLMIGGPDSFGAGGWRGSALEAAMPVDFEIKNTRIRAVGALMLVLDTSGSMDGQKIQLCRAAARSAIESLGSTDFVGVVTFDSETKETIPLQQVNDPRRMKPALSRIAASGGTDMFPAMSLGYAKLSRVDAMVKHMIIVTDGQTNPGQFDQLTRQMRQDSITVSTLAVGADADQTLLNRIASQGGGKYYAVKSPLAIPQIVLRESRRVAKPLIYEVPEGMVPLKSSVHPIIDGIESLPPVTGMVLTTPKTSPLVQNLLMAPQPVDGDYPLLSVWTYGLGHTAAVTTDSAPRWSSTWMDSPSAKQLLGQLVRWLKRPTDGSDQYDVVSHWKNGEAKVIVDNLRPDESTNDLIEFEAAMIGSDGEPIPLSLRQVAPGRFIATAAVTDPGSYFVQVVPSDTRAPIVRGFNVPFGIEYATNAHDTTVLHSIADAKPVGGQPGEVSQPIGSKQTAPSLVNHFRDGLQRHATMQDVWPWLVFVSCLIFLGDIGNRRLTIAWPWKRKNLAEELLAGDRAPRPVDRLSRPTDAGQPNPATKSNAGVTNRFESDAAAETTQPEIDPRPYTQRLLEAKRRARANESSDKYES